MEKEAAHMSFGRAGPKVVSPLGQWGIKNAARRHFSEHFGCVGTAGDPQALPEGLQGSDGDRRWWESAWVMWGCADTGGGTGMQAEPERPTGAGDAVTAGNTHPVTVGLCVVGKQSTILYRSGSERRSFSLDRKVRALPPGSSSSSFSLGRAAVCQQPNHRLCYAPLEPFSTLLFST